MIRDTALAIALAPLLAWQAIALQRRALRLPEAPGPRSGHLGNGPDLKLLIVGDSSAAGVGAPSQDLALAGQMARALAPHHAVQWDLIARTSITTRETLQTLRNHDLPVADVVVLVLGVNDVTKRANRRQWLRDHAALRDLLRKRTGARAIYISQVPPLGAFPLLPDPLRMLLGRRSLRFDAALRAQLASETDSHYVPLPETLDPADMAEDGFHPGPAIYAAWGTEMARRILSDGPDSQNP